MEKTYIEFDNVKKSIKDLEMIAHDKMISKVRELNSIVDHIESNWRGANSEKYRKGINEINDAIEEFRINCLEHIVTDIEGQVGTYEVNENGE